MNIFPDIQLPPLRLIDIERQVCKEYNMTPFVIRLKSRVREHVEARHEFIVRACRHYKQQEVADYIGMERSTISSTLKSSKYKKWYKNA